MTMLVLLLLSACGDGRKSKKDGGRASSVATADSSEADTTAGSPPTTPGPTGLIRFDGPVPKNMLWISIDTHRRDLWARYGGTSLMPFLDGLMAEGFVLDDLQQCSNWTGAGTSCTMAGRHGIDDGYEPILGTSNPKDRVPDKTVFMAEVMAERGYRTGLVSSNGWLNPEWGNTQGYDTFRARGGSKAEAVMDELLLDLLTVPDEQPWFFHAHLYDPHAPYNPPDAYLDALEGRPELPWDLSDRDQHYSVNSRAAYSALDPGTQIELETQLRIRYEAESTFMDVMLRDAWGVYDAAGLLDDTLVVFWADHGEAFWEHGRQTHAWDLYAEENQVAAFFWSKNIIPGSFAGPASTIDIAPTVLDLYGIEAPPTMTGLVLDDIEPGRVRFSMANARAGIIQSVTQGNRRIQMYWRDGSVVVTDAGVDPSETIDLYAPDDPTTLEMWELLKPRIEQAEAALGTERWPLNWPPELPR